MLNKVVGIKNLGGFKLQVMFSDSAFGIVDFESILRDGGPVGQKALEADCFARFFLEYGALTWPNGYDICPDWLRMEMVRTASLNEAALT
jgi:Protein of unknown function (DUF2442)